MEVKRLCLAINCRKPEIANGYCNTHYKRWYRHGHVAPTRPLDWGAREKHPLYGRWCGLRRHRNKILCERWKSNFWDFVADIGKAPKNRRLTLERLDDLRPLGPENWFWAMSKRSAERKEGADPDWYKNKYLQRHYGITLAQYEQMFQAQAGVCAICGKPETLEIRGKRVRLSVDHCHDTDRVRALLCSKHNRGLGLFNHSQELLVKAIKYLQLHQETK